MADKRTGYGGGNSGGDPTASPTKSVGKMHGLKGASASDPYDTERGQVKGQFTAGSGGTMPKTTAVPDPTTGDGPTNLGSGPYAGDRKGGSGR